ncbi:MAG: hypothetical protein IT439_09365 [Phycisphaerales bacterium]|nr:hypothetical protein [Phycisphaerales bacterium]
MSAHTLSSRVAIVTGGAKNLGGLISRERATHGWWITGQTIFANGGYTTR